MKYFQKIILIGFIILFGFIGTGSKSLSNGAAAGSSQEAQFYRVYFNDIALARKIVRSMNAIESPYEEGYVLVEINNAADMEKLLDLGMTIVQVDNPYTEGPSMDALTSGISGYPCYRTVEETFATVTDAWYSGRGDGHRPKHLTLRSCKLWAESSPTLTTTHRNRRLVFIPPMALPIVLLTGNWESPPIVLN